MPFYLAHVGTWLKKVSTAGVFSSPLTLPGSESVTTSRPMRAAIMGKFIVVVNCPSVNLSVDAGDLTVRVLSITEPTTAPAVAVGATGVKNGVYRHRYSFAIKDAGGNVLTESPWSSASDPITLTDQQANLTSISTSSTTGVNCRRLYVTTNGGEDYYNFHDFDDNSASTYSDNLSDYDIGLLPVVDYLGNPPGHDSTDYFKLIVAWKDRLWAVGHEEPDTVWFSGQNKNYGWAPSHTLLVKPVGQDEVGVSAFMARRDELGIAKRRCLWKILGNSESDFRSIRVADGIGCVSQETVVVIRDIARFLGTDGVYEWGPEGVVSISREKVHGWFTTDDYFNRSRFPNAFAHYNQLYDMYELHLASTASTYEDQWVAYDVRKKTWFGPHKTVAFSASCAATMENPDGMLIPVVGAEDGHLYVKNSSTASDDGHAIEFSVINKFHSGNAPDIMHFWGELAMLTKVQTTGSLSVIPYVGGLDASASATISVDLTKGRQRLRRLGTGRLCQLRLYENTVGVKVEIYGYELPFFELGRR